MMFRIRNQAITLVLAAFSLVGCQTAPKSLISDDSIFHKNMMVAIDSEKGKRGVQVAPRKPSAILHISTPQKPEFVRITTCHREDIIRKPGKRFDYRYTPTAIETGYCLMEIAAFDEDGEHGWHLIDWKEDEQLEAEISCSGKKERAVGASMCQSRAGLLQRVVISGADISHKSIEGCPIVDHSNGYFEYEMKKGKCLFVFSDGKDIHRHTAFGYAEVRTK